MRNQSVEAMSCEDVLDELFWFRDLIQKYEELGQGMATKESVRFRALKTRLGNLDPDALAEYEDNLYG